MRIRKAFLLLTALGIFGVFLCSRSTLGQEQTGVVKGTAQYVSGKPLTGVWVIISNQDPGTSYRVDSGPHEGVFPGKYVFGFSPSQFDVQSPQQIEVRPGETVTVTVVVAPSSQSTWPGLR